MNFYKKLINIVKFPLKIIRTPHEREVVFAHKKNLIIKKIELFLREIISLVKISQLNRASLELSYSFILAIIPAIAVVFTGIHSIPFINTIVESSLSPVLVGHFGFLIGGTLFIYIENVVQNLEISSLGMGAFFAYSITMFLLFLRIEIHFNHIAGVIKKSALWFRMLKFILLIGVSPMFLGLVFLKSEITQFMLTGWVAQSLLFGCFYFIMPAIRFRFMELLCGGIVASILLEIIQKISIILTKVSIYGASGAIYGTIPLMAILFFIWVRFVWVVVLLGMVVTVATHKVFFYSKSID